MSTTAAASPSRAHAPTAVAGSLALLLAAGTVLAVGSAPRQTTVLALVVLGVVCLGARNTPREQGRATEWLLVGAGLLLFTIAAWSVATAPLTRLDTAVLLPGTVGVAVLGLGLVPVAHEHSEMVATVGAALVFVAVLVAGVAQLADRTILLAATVGVVAAWDGARSATTLSRQVGRAADTVVAEAVHVGATLATGLVVVALAETVWRVGATGLPLTGLLLFLGAALALLAYLYS